MDTTEKPDQVQNQQVADQLQTTLPRADALSDYTSPIGRGAIVQAFANDLASSGGMSTARSYRPRAANFLRWVDQNGLSLSALPTEAPDAFLRHLGTINESSWNGYLAALKAFERFLRQNGVDVPELVYPPTKIVKRKKKMSEAVIPPIDAPVTVPVPGLDPQTLKGNGALPQEATSAVETRVSKSPVAASKSTGDASESAGDVSPVPLTEAQSPLGNPVSKTPVTDRRHTQARDPLSAFLPRGGWLRISRRATKEDGASPGGLFEVGTYTARDLVGYSDIVPFIRENIHPFQPDEAKTATVTVYMVERLSDAGQPTGAPSRTVIANYSGSAPPPGMSSPPQEAPRPQPPAITAGDLAQATARGDLLLEKFAEQQAELTKVKAEAEKQQAVREAREETLHEIEARSAAGKATSSDLALWKLLMEQQAKTSLPAAPALSGVQESPRIDASTEILRDVISKMAERVFTPPSPSPTPVPVIPERREKFLDALMEAAIARMVAPPVADPALVKVIEKIEARLEKGNPGLIQHLGELETIMRYTERLSGGGSSSLLDSVLEKIPEVLSGVSDVIRAQKGVKAPILKDGAQGAAQKVKVKNPSRTVLPVMAVQALHGLTKDSDDQTTTNYFFSIVNALAEGGDDWRLLSTEILKVVQKLGSADGDRRLMLQNVVVNVYRRTGAQGLLTRPALDRIVDVLIRRYDEIYFSLLGSQPEKPFGPRGESADTENPAVEMNEMAKEAHEDVQANAEQTVQEVKESVQATEDESGEAKAESIDSSESLDSSETDDSSETEDA